MKELSSGLWVKIAFFSTFMNFLTFRRIFDWMRQIPKLQELIAKGHMKKMTGRGPKNRDIDQALYDWYSQRRAAGERPRSCEVSLVFSQL